MTGLWGSCRLLSDGLLQKPNVLGNLYLVISFPICRDMRLVSKGGFQKTCREIKCKMFSAKFVFMICTIYMNRNEKIIEEPKVPL